MTWPVPRSGSAPGGECRWGDRYDRLPFWFEAHVIADVALTRRETLRLERLIRQDDPRLQREIEEVQTSLVERRQFTEEFARRLGVFVSRAGRIEGVFDRLRFIKRARLESLILELE